MASLRIFVPFHVRSKIDPLEHIMRAPNAAQGGDRLSLLPKSLNSLPLFQQRIVFSPLF
jgi:hypothetical protein